MLNSAVPTSRDGRAAQRSAASGIMRALSQGHLALVFRLLVESFSHASSVANDVGEVFKIFVFEARGQLQVVAHAQVRVSVGEVKLRGSELAPVHVPAAVYRGAEPRHRHAHFHASGAEELVLGVGGVLVEQEVEVVAHRPDARVNGGHYDAIARDLAHLRHYGGVAGVVLLHAGLQVADEGEHHGGRDLGHAHRQVGGGRHSLLAELVRGAHGVFVVAALVGSGPVDELGSHRVVVGAHEASLAAVDHLVRLRGVRGHRAVATQRLAFELHAAAVGAVLDQSEAVALAQSHHLVHVGHLAAHVAQEQHLGLGVGRRLGLQVRQVHGPVARGFHEHRLRTEAHDGGGQGGEGEAVGEDLVARLDAHCHEAEEDGGRARVHAHRVLQLHQLRKSFFRSGSVAGARRGGAVAKEAAGLHDLHRSLDTLL